MTDQTPDFDPEIELNYLRETPADALLGNHFFVLAQWAAVHLASIPADLVGAQLVIDVMAAMLDTAGERIGANASLYRSALAEIQQVFVRASLTPKSHEPASHEPASHEPASHEPASHEPASHEPASHDDPGSPV